ncbi:hypothetical protein BDQ12DRAFT_252647 [Crucibulum laeve]|uniref:MYND-type domain-containing protein n=1 Tax=Crucibulum laeve TaxID=68775 RepID=A0A5C3LSL2_9AGAR|nr:hypothetical protein BDQ12DRAFT_252647 [Crucibulum laeve]
MSLLSKSELNASEIAQVKHLIERHRSEGESFKAMGDWRSAMRSYLSLIPYLDKLYGMDSLECANGFIGLGECSICIGEIEGAEEAFNQVLKVRESKEFGGLGLGSKEEAAQAREYLARLKEKQGQLVRARALRARGEKDKSMRCSNMKCTKSLLRREALNACSGCRCAFYCSTECQFDWSRHKAPCKENGAAAKTLMAA